MRVAFFAPLKPLDDPVPSGDRQMGRLIVRALEAAGHAVVQPTRIRLWSKQGGDALLEKEGLGRAEAERLIAPFRQGGAPEAWITYHLYHKAPDWLGPIVAEALDIPYVAMEASRALKRREGEWAYGFAAADAALRRADAVAACHEIDARGLAPVVPSERLMIVPPFIDAAPFAASKKGPRGSAPLRLLTVAMMRDGDKMASYRVLGEALSKIGDLDWRLTLAGDGPMRDAVLALFPPERIDWRGQLGPDDLVEAYTQADLFVWPAVREAYGLVLMEAQASAVPVIAGATGGVPEIVRDGETGWLVPVGDASAFAQALRTALGNPERLVTMGQRARAYVLERHDITAASARLDTLLDRALTTHRKRTQDPCRQNRTS